MLTMPSLGLSGMLCRITSFTSLWDNPSTASDKKFVYDGKRETAHGPRHKYSEHGRFVSPLSHSRLTTVVSASSQEDTECAD